MTIAYLALGSNRGDRAARLRGAVRRLHHHSHVEVVAVSRVYETDPVGGPAQAPFLNSVVAVETGLDARELLELAQSIEIAEGREPDPARRVRWGPRELDVDLLTVGGVRMDETDLVIPHPRMRERGFVLAPLRDVAPDHPVFSEIEVPEAGWPGVRPVDVELEDESGTC